MAKPVLRKSLCSDWFFLGQDFAVRTVSMETVQPVYFCFGAKPANSKFATKTAKKNCEYCHSSQWNYQKKLKRLKFFRNFKDGWRRRTFSKRVLLSWRSGNFWCRNWNRHHFKTILSTNRKVQTEKCKHKDKKKTYARAYVSLWLCIFVTLYVRMVVERANKVEGTMSWGAETSEILASIKHALL